MSRPIPLVIVGAGGFGRELLDLVQEINRLAPTFDLLGFLDDDESRGPIVLKRSGLAVLGPVGQLKVLDAQYLIGIGGTEPRRRIDALVTSHGRRAATVVHPAATVGARVVLGPGAVVAAGARLTTDIRVGRHSQVHTNATIGHDTEVGDYVTVLPGAIISGNVCLDAEVTIGAGSVVLQGLTIGSRSTVGAGAVVVRDLATDEVVVGVPARPIGR
jgi:sugar O-acyltransferase (sialic acid O-acetyltransferase NeuD family)